MISFLRKALVRFFLFCFNYSGLYRTTMLPALKKYIEGSNKGNQEFLSVFKTNINQAIDNTPYLIFNNYQHIERAITIAHFLKIPTRGVIVDVGGFNGEVAVKFATAFPQSQVYTFEPIGKHFDILQNNIRPYPTILPFNIALGNSTEEKQIHKLTNDSSSSLLEVSRSIDNRFFATNLSPKETERISVKKLDDVLPTDIAHISILKIDVQGFELHVLKGSVKTLKKVFMIVLEMQNHDFYQNAPMYFDLDEYLRNHGFGLFDLVPAIRNEMKLYEWDAIYINTTLLENHP